MSYPIRSFDAWAERGRVVCRPEVQTPQRYCSASRTVRGIDSDMLCDCKLCWVCELSATLLSYSSLTLCHQPQCHEYPFGPVVSKWVVSFLGHSVRCFSLKCGSTWKHQIQTIGWHAHAQRMYPMLTSHCDLPLLAAWIRSECPPYFGCLASVLEALLIDLMLDGLLPRFSRQPMAWGREDMGTLTSRPAMNLLWTCYEPAMNLLWTCYECSVKRWCRTVAAARAPRSKKYEHGLWHSIGRNTSKISVYNSFDRQLVTSRRRSVAIFSA